jgi:hypothetical protein
MTFSTNRKNRCVVSPRNHHFLRNPVPRTPVPFRRNRVLRLSVTNRKSLVESLNPTSSANPGITPATSGTNGNNRDRTKPKLSTFQHYAAR